MPTTAFSFEKVATAIGTYWRDKSASYNHLKRLVKQATLGGEQSEGFEQAFSSLAYAYLKDKAPRLLDFIIGFQLVDRNEDNTKAVGIFGFKVGDQWLYAPVFFLNGDLKGHELMYLKKQDMFVPLKENWVNHVISRKPHILGEASAKNTFQLGGLLPNLNRLAQPPVATKFSSDLGFECSEWAQPFIPFLAAVVADRGDVLFAKQAGVAESLDLRNFLRSFPLLKLAYEKAYQQYPLIKEGFDKFYGKDFWVKMASNALNDAADLTKQSRCWEGYEAVPGKAAYSEGSCRKIGEKKEKKSNDILPAAAETHPIKTGALKITMQNIEMSGDIEDLDADTLKGILPDDIQDKITDIMKRSADADNDKTINEGDDKRLNSTDADRKKLLDDGVLIVDKRDPHAVSMAFNTQVRMEMMNPNESGLYEVLEKPGTFTKMVVLSNPASGRGRENTILVLRQDDPRSWLHTHRSNVYAKSCDCPLPSDFRKYVNGLSSIDSCEEGATYVAIHEIGSGTCPFKIREKLGDGSYRVEWLDYADLPRFGNLAARTCMHPMTDNLNGYRSWDAKIRINRNPGTNLRTVGGEMYIPSDYKVIKVKDKYKPSEKSDDGILPCCSSAPFQENSKSDPAPIELGNLQEAQLMLYEKMASIRLHDVGTEVIVDSKIHGTHRLNKTAALVHLVGVHGFAEKQARVMLKEAASARPFNEDKTYFVKYAAPFNNSLLAGGPNVPGFPEPFYSQEPVGRGMYPSRYPEEYTALVPGMDSNLTDPKIYDPFYMPDQKAMYVGQQASQSGQKEVFDTAMISGLIKTVRQDGLVDRYLGDLMKALDKLGRILFLFYWHQDEFEDRYGKQDMPELEDTLRNAFEVLGDLVLFLKEKTVQGGAMYDSGVGRPDPGIEQATGD